MGTSLSVQPFASLPGFVLEGVPRVLINLERVGGLGSRPDDVCILSECDEGIRNLADALGWREELEVLWKEVSGKEEGEDSTETTTQSKTKDNLLEEEIAKLTSDVDRTLKLSNGHKKWLEDHLSNKIAKGPSDVLETTALQATNDESQAMPPVDSGVIAVSEVGDNNENIQVFSLPPTLKPDEKAVEPTSSPTQISRTAASEHAEAPQLGPSTIASGSINSSEDVDDSKPNL